MLKDRSAHVRGITIGALHALNASEAVPELMKLVPDASTPVRTYLPNALGDLLMASPKATTEARKLGPYLVGKSRVARETAAWAAGQLEGPSLMALLPHLLTCATDEDEDDSASYRAFRAIQGIGPSVADKVVPVLAKCFNGTLACDPFGAVTTAAIYGAASRELLPAMKRVQVAPFRSAELHGAISAVEGALHAADAGTSP